MRKHIAYDPETDSSYVTVGSDKVIESVPLGRRIILDFSKKHEIQGVEILEAVFFFTDLFGMTLKKKELSGLQIQIHKDDELHFHFFHGQNRAHLAMPNPNAISVLKAG